MPERYTILGGKVHVYKRPHSTLWQCSTYFAGKNRRSSTNVVSPPSVSVKRPCSAVASREAQLSQLISLAA